jgi:hypothetical protein
MKRNINKYTTVTKLPANAMTVSQYAALKQYTTNYVYNQIRMGKNIDFKIVIFQSFNFVIPI